MTEGYLLIISFLKSSGVTLCALLYAAGGGVNNWPGNWKWCRVVYPFLGALVLTLTAGFNWWILVYGPLLWGALTVSYGDESHLRTWWAKVLGAHKYDLKVKVMTRITCGFVWSLPAWFLVVLGANPIFCMVYQLTLMIISGSEEFYDNQAIPTQFIRGIAILWLPMFMLF